MNFLWILRGLNIKHSWASTPGFGVIYEISHIDHLKGEMTKTLGESVVLVVGVKIWAGDEMFFRTHRQTEPPVMSFKEFVSTGAQI